MNKKRLLKLADFLDTVRAEKFDMNNWGRSDPLSCGTVACALGYAGTMKEFKRVGLRTEFNEFGGTVTYDPPARNHPYQGVFEDLEAAEEFFKLTYDEAEYLFMPNKYGFRKGPKTVAGRIRRLVRDGEIPAREKKKYFTSSCNY